MTFPQFIQIEVAPRTYLPLDLASLFKFRYVALHEWEQKSLALLLHKITFPHCLHNLGFFSYLSFVSTLIIGISTSFLTAYSFNLFLLEVLS